MDNLLKVGRVFYGVAIAAYGLQQILIKDFRPQIVPVFPAWAHQYAFIPIVTGVILVLAGLLVTGLFPVKTITKKDVCLYLGCYFLFLILFCQLPYTLVISPNKAIHLGVWVDTLKELAYCGGAFVLAGSYRQGVSSAAPSNAFTAMLEKLVPLGPVFFSIMLILFGYSHFLYTDFVAPLVPSYFGMAHFWTLFAGTALIVSGIAIMFRMFLQPVAYLLALMLILWVILLHAPRAISDPHSGNGNQIVSAFDALLFCGVALVIGARASRKRLAYAVA
jgi:uncharacterized membrane protein